MGSDGWKTHVELIRKAADLISERRNELAALMAIEVGKNRLEALGDVEETADLIRYNAKEIEDHNGFRVPMEALGSNGRLLRRAAPLRRVGRDQPVQLPDGAGRRARRPARWWPATPWCSSRSHQGLLHRR